MVERIRVGGVPEHFNLPWRLALENGLFDPLGVEVSYADYPGGTGAMAEALARGDLDLALMLTEGAVFDVVSGSGNRLVKVYVDSPLIWGIHVAARSDIESPADMAGRPVAISRHGSGSHLIAVVDALERNFDVRSMEFVVVDNLDGARAALADGAAEVFLWEKHMTQPLVDSGEFRRIGEREVPWPAFVAAVRDAVANDSGDALRQILTLVHTVADELEDRADAAELIADRYGIAVADAANWLARVSWSESFARPDAALRRVLDALHAQGAIPDPNAPLERIWHRL